jgi:hypothetical protein
MGRRSSKRNATMEKGWHTTEVGDFVEVEEGRTWKRASSRKRVTHDVAGLTVGLYPFFPFAARASFFGARSYGRSIPVSLILLSRVL